MSCANYRAIWPYSLSGPSSPRGHSIAAERRRRATRRSSRRSRALARRREALSKARRHSTVAFRLAYQDALLCLKTGDREQYRRLCAGLIRAAGKEIDPHAANNIAMACALGPDAVPDWRPVVALMEHPVERIALTTRDGSASGAELRHVFLNTLGAVLYRVGRFREAAGRLTETTATAKAEFHDCVFLAMAHERLGQAEEAWLGSPRQANVCPPTRPLSLGTGSKSCSSTTRARHVVGRCGTSCSVHPSTSP
jgi:hypothetical protein